MIVSLYASFGLGSRARKSRFCWTLSQIGPLPAMPIALFIYIEKVIVLLDCGREEVSCVDPIGRRLVREETRASLLFTFSFRW